MGVSRVASDSNVENLAFALGKNEFTDLTHDKFAASCTVEQFTLFEHAREPRSFLDFFSELDDARCCNFLEESGVVRFLLVLFNYGRFVYITAWRNITTDPIENNQLAVCDETYLVAADTTSSLRTCSCQEVSG